jgi:hypothetical protein
MTSESPPTLHRHARRYLAMPSDEPFRRVVVDNFFAKEELADIIANFPKPSEPGWWVYDNPIEQKKARDVAGILALEKVFARLESPEVLARVRRITGIPDLEVDPHRHGAGLHCYERGGKLQMHVDYSVHPISYKTRSVNMLIYVTPEWDAAAWGGHLVIDGVSIEPKCNRAVIFRTDDTREPVHGMPAPLTCPEDVSRNSIAIYYVRDGPPLHGKSRPKAEFFPPEGTTDPRLLKLYAIRKTRRLEPDDLL